MTAAGHNETNKMGAVVPHPHHLVHTLLGEARVKNPDSVLYKGKVVYLNIKKPIFLRMRSIRENILFGETMIKKRYDKIIEEVGLNLKSFKSGDLTDVKGNGMNLSMEQKRKILMARGIYASGDIYILEGLFGNIENDSIGYLAKSQKSEGSKELWTKLTTGNGVLRHKTVLLVEDMEGKTSNALKFEEIIKKMNKTIVFAFKGAEYGTKKESENGIYEYKTFDNYYKCFASKLLGIHVTREVNKRKTVSEKTNMLLDRAKGKFGNKNGGGGMDLFNSKALKEINVAQKDDNFNLLHRTNNKTPTNANGAKMKSFSDAVPKEQEEGYIILKLLMKGIVKVLKGKSKGQIKSTYREEHLYYDLNKYIYEYIMSKGKARIIFQLCIYVITVGAFIGKHTLYLTNF